MCCVGCCCGEGRRCGGFSSRCVVRMDWRVGRGVGVWCGVVGCGACEEYPSRRLAVTRYRCSARGAGGMGGGASPGCGSAGSLRLVGAVRVGEVVVGYCEAGPVSGRRGTLWVRCHLLMVSARRLAVRDVRFGVKCGVDLDSPGKRGLDCSDGRRGVLSSAQGLVEDGVDGGCNVPRRGRYGCSEGWFLRLYPSGSLSLVGVGRAKALAIGGLR